MVTLHIAKLLEDNGFGTLEQDIFWEDMPVDANGKPFKGIWVVPRGSDINRFNTTTQSFDVYSRNSNKVDSSKILEDILEFFKESYADVCDLPQVPPYSDTEYINVRIRPISSIENVGADEQDMIVRVISAEVQYNIKKEQ